MIHHRKDPPPRDHASGVPRDAEAGGRHRKLWLAGILVGLALAGMCGQALAQGARFGVQLRVLPARGNPEAALPALPRPPQVQVLPPGHHADRLLYAGSVSDARAFYASALPALGFQLMQRTADSSLWERDDARAELHFYPVTGTEAIGIIVRMSRPGAADAQTALSR
ncbi:hypothetical protein [Lysobacter solisilvae (ex Woo and Kim 2020)]|uniref:Uncharacterized protein n=1 Tax=Agrilutibacter terrestris TaxID=2865112 RepID=A0A7H0FVK7_9GAMM|nr:hypothetical protein [Lysobacter terrestris]QNP40073.1 hypothetical protein H8B22_11275 [Lysobacter terrestris]